jgi:hypothetical protein
VVPNVHVARQVAADYLQRLSQLGQVAKRVTSRNLSNFLHLGLIATLFPHARVIHCRRDPLDICLSCYFLSFQELSYTWSLEHIGAYYRSYEKLMAHWTRVLPIRVHEVRYEDLVGNQEAVSRDLVAFCGLDWEDRCLTFWKTRRAVQTHSSVQVRNPVYAQSIGRWKYYRSYLKPLCQALGHALDGQAAGHRPIQPGVLTFVRDCQGQGG